MPLLALGVSLGTAVDALNLAELGIQFPPGVHADFHGTAQAFTSSPKNEPLLVLAALLTVRGLGAVGCLTVALRGTLSAGVCLDPMSNVFSIAPSKTNTLRFVPGIPFVCGLSWDDCWSSDAVFRVSSDDGSQRGDFTRDQGEEADGLIFFAFAGARPNVRYQGSIVDGDVEYKLFGLVEIARLTDPDDPCTNLPIPDCVCTLPDADDGSPGTGDE